MSIASWITAHPEAVVALLAIAGAWATDIRGQRRLSEQVREMWHAHEVKKERDRIRAVLAEARAEESSRASEEASGTHRSLSE